MAFVPNMPIPVFTVLKKAASGETNHAASVAGRARPTREAAPAAAPAIATRPARHATHAREVDRDDDIMAPTTW